MYNLHSIALVSTVYDLQSSLKWLRCPVTCVWQTNITSTKRWNDEFSICSHFFLGGGIKLKLNKQNTDIIDKAKSSIRCEKFLRWKACP